MREGGPGFSLRFNPGYVNTTSTPINEMAGTCPATSEETQPAHFAALADMPLYTSLCRPCPVPAT
jgi:hypothetical protein